MRPHSPIATPLPLLSVLLAMDLTLAAELRPEGGIALHAHPEAPLVAPEEGSETLFRGYLGAASDASLGDDAFFVGDARLYRPAEPGDLFVDARAELTLAGGDATLRGGLLRERWGRAERSRLDALTARNRVFGLTEELRPIAQPGLLVSRPLGAMLELELAALLGNRRTAHPEPLERRSFGLELDTESREGALGHGAIAARLSGFLDSVEWAAQVFVGEGREPTYVLAAVPEGGAAILAVHDHLAQLGLELEGSIGDWRLWAEGFHRRGGRDARGVETSYSHAAVGAEYQYFAAFDGALDLIVELAAAFDGRGEHADLPFENGLSVGARLRGTAALPWSSELVLATDTESGGDARRLSIEKELSESPRLAVAFTAESVRAGERGTILDVLERDESAALALRWEF